LKKLLNTNFKLFFITVFSFNLTIGCAQENLLQQSLGDAINIIASHTHAKTARLKVISVDEHRKNTFKSNKTIVGYPITEELETIDYKKSKKLADILLNNNNYAHGVLQRCKNKFFYGIRFTKNQQKVEVALGLSCNQLLVAFKEDEEIKIWGSVLGLAATKQVILLLNH